jgi:hypothetical protein
MTDNDMTAADFEGRVKAGIADFVILTSDFVIALYLAYFPIRLA